MTSATRSVINMEQTLELIDDAARAIDRVGITLVPSGLVDDVVRQGREAGASPIALGVLADPTERRVVRERAFVRVASRVIGNARLAA